MCSEKRLDIRPDTLCYTEFHVTPPDLQYLRSKRWLVEAMYFPQTMQAKQ